MTSPSPIALAKFASAPTYPPSSFSLAASNAAISLRKMSRSSHAAYKASSSLSSSPPSASVEGVAKTSSYHPLRSSLCDCAAFSAPFELMCTTSTLVKVEDEDEPRVAVALGLASVVLVLEDALPLSFTCLTLTSFYFPFQCQFHNLKPRSSSHPAASSSFTNFIKFLTSRLLRFYTRLVFLPLLLQSLTIFSASRA